MNTRVKLGQYEAWVVVEDQEIEHFAIEVNEETKVASCWIASTVGKHFDLRAAKTHTNFDCAASFSLDGTSIEGIKILKKSLEPSICNHVSTGEQTARPILFGTLNLTDDETLLANEASYVGLGEIKIIIQRITILKSRKCSSRNRVSEIGDMHERSKKAITHKISFGKEFVTQSIKPRSTRSLEIVATFIFHYRSLDILKANGIVPHDPTPDIGPSSSSHLAISSKLSTSGKPLASKVKEEPDNEEVIDSDEEDQRKEAELLAELEKVKKARLARNQDRNQDERPKKKVKKEIKPAFLPGEVIDLTL